MDNTRCEELFFRIESEHINKILEFYNEVPAEIDWLKDVSIIMERMMHNLSLRPFGDYLKGCLFYSCGMDKRYPDHMSVPDEEYISIMREEFSRNGMAGVCSLENDSPANDEHFFKSLLRKENADRSIVFLLGFGLGMNENTTSDFLTKVIRQSDFNFKDAREAIYFYCLKNQLGYEGVKRYLKIYSELTPATETFAEKYYTSDIEKLYLTVESHEDFVELLAQLKAGTSISGYTKAEVFRNLLESLRQQAKLDKIAFYHDDFPEKDLSEESLDDVSLFAIEKYIYYSDTRNSHNNMMPNSSSVFSGKKWFLDTKLTRQNLSLMLEGKRSITRNDIITMVFLNEDLWLGEIDKPYERFMDFQYTVNDYLLMCRFAKFYPQNPYETFIGMCIASDNPQDTFKQIWSESFKVR